MQRRRHTMMRASIWSAIAGLAAALLAVSADADPDWKKATPWPTGGLANPYRLPPAERDAALRRGKLHALNWPVKITGMLLPYEPIKRFTDSFAADDLWASRPGPIDSTQSAAPFDEGIARLRLKWGWPHPISEAATPQSFDEWTAWLGLHPYPPNEGEGVYFVPFPPGGRPEHRMGVSLIERFGETGVTFSCVSCHAGRLFGRVVIGMTNRFPRANVLMHHGRYAALAVLPLPFFMAYTGATLAQTRVYAVAREAMKMIEARVPAVVGLDTSLAHVALSLSRRNPDPYASPRFIWKLAPRPEPLRYAVADSKPPPWWNVRYKNRWLLDGSLVAGNPVVTNLLWNEIGRGTDLRLLQRWLARNDAIVRDLTAMVFASEAPHITDFFPASRIDERAAKRGEKLFLANCSRCHGQYHKAWSKDNAQRLSPAERLRTVRVEYFRQTRVIDVGTDGSRRDGMNSLLQLNRLAIAEAHGIRLERSDGYVPPPLVGIWARWPYFHNNSVPSLCALLRRPQDRPRRFWMGEAQDPARDFDFDCNGYPTGDDVPRAWMSDPHFRYDTTQPGLSNAGHYAGILEKDGREILSRRDRRDLIVFLQTL